MTHKYNNKFKCSKCKNLANKIKVMDCLNFTICECKTKCLNCGFEDYWAYGFFESGLNNKLPFLFDELELSRWSYLYCLNKEDDPEIRKYITNPEWVYMYCRYIDDDPEIRKYITNSKWAYMYCSDVNDDPLIRKYITDSHWVNKYCRMIDIDSEFRKNIKDV